MNDDYYIFRAAHQGDNSLLIEFIRSDAELTREHRELIAKLLGGEIQRPPHRQRSIVKQRRRAAIGARARELESEMKQMAAIAQAASEYGCSEKTVKIALQGHRRRERRLAKFRAIMELAKEGDIEWLQRSLTDKINDKRAEVGLKKRWYPPAFFEFVDEEENK
jgi:hypothetical protein